MCPRRSNGRFANSGPLGAGALSYNRGGSSAPLARRGCATSVKLRATRAVSSPQVRSSLALMWSSAHRWPCCASRPSQLKHANAPHPLRLLRVRCKRPSRRAAQHRDEMPSPHSISSSARASRDGGTVRPNIRAVWALMTSSNPVGCTTGRSAGRAPLRMRPA